MGHGCVFEFERCWEDLMNGLGRLSRRFLACHSGHLRLLVKSHFKVTIGIE